MQYLYIYIFSLLIIETFYQVAVRMFGDLGEIEGVSVRTAFFVIGLLPILNTIMAMRMVIEYFKSNQQH